MHGANLGTSFLLRGKSQISHTRFARRHAARSLQALRVLQSGQGLHRFFPLFLARSRRNADLAGYTRPAHSARAVLRPVPYGPLTGATRFPGLNSARAPRLHHIVRLAVEMEPGDWPRAEVVVNTPVIAPWPGARESSCPDGVRYGAPAERTGGGQQ